MLCTALQYIYVKIEFLCSAFEWRNSSLYSAETLKILF